MHNTATERSGHHTTDEGLSGVNVLLQKACPPGWRKNMRTQKCTLGYFILDMHTPALIVYFVNSLDLRAIGITVGYENRLPTRG